MKNIYNLKILEITMKEKKLQNYLFQIYKSNQY